MVAEMADLGVLRANGDVGRVAMTTIKDNLLQPDGLAVSVESMAGPFYSGNEW